MPKRVVSPGCQFDHELGICFGQRTKTDDLFNLFTIFWTNKAYLSIAFRSTFHRGLLIKQLWFDQWTMELWFTYGATTSINRVQISIQLLVGDRISWHYMIILGSVLHVPSALWPWLYPFIDGRQGRNWACETWEATGRCSLFVVILSGSAKKSDGDHARLQIPTCFAICHGRNDPAHFVLPGSLTNRCLEHWDGLPQWLRARLCSSAMMICSKCGTFSAHSYTTWLHSKKLTVYFSDLEENGYFKRTNCDIHQVHHSLLWLMMEKKLHLGIETSVAKSETMGNILLNGIFKVN